jgi:hypothetical protein
MLWLQNPNESNVDNLNNVRSEVRRHFINKKKEYLKDKIVELENISKIKKISEIFIGSLGILKRVIRL